jgi:hypothetical protein
MRDGRRGLVWHGLTDGNITVSDRFDLENTFTSCSVVERLINSLEKKEDVLGLALRRPGLCRRLEYKGERWSTKMGRHLTINLP